jgi:hypothetical protein
VRGCSPPGRHLRGVLGGLIKEEFKVHWMIHQRLLDDEGSSILREVNMEGGHADKGDMQALNGKRFKIFAVPTWDVCFSTYCF